MDADSLCYCLCEPLGFTLKKPTLVDKSALCSLASVQLAKIASDAADRMGPKLYFLIAFLSSRLKSKASDVDKLAGNIQSKGICY